MSQPPNGQDSQVESNPPSVAGQPAPLASPQYEAPPPNAPRYEAPVYQAPPQAPAYPQPGFQPAPPPGHAPAPPPNSPGNPGAWGYFDGAAHAAELNRPLYGATFGQSFSRFFKNYANFKGRASRSEFWWMVLIYWGAFFALAVLVGVTQQPLRNGALSALTEMVSVLVGFAFLAMMLGTFVPWLAITWRRLHDANLPGSLWFISFVPYLGSLVVLIFTILPPRPEGRRFDPPIR